MPRDYQPGTPFLQLADTLLGIDRENQANARHEKALQQHLDQTKQRAAMDGWNIHDDGTIERDPTFAQRMGKESRGAKLAGEGVETAQLPGQLTPEQILGTRSPQGPGMPVAPRGEAASEAIQQEIQRGLPTRQGFRSTETGEEREEIPGKGFLNLEDAKVHRRTQEAGAKRAEHQADTSQVRMPDGSWVDMTSKERTDYVRSQNAVAAPGQRRDAAEDTARASEEAGIEEAQALLDGYLVQEAKAPGTDPRMAGEIIKARAKIAGHRAKLARLGGTWPHANAAPKALKDMSADELKALETELRGKKK